jgi:signal transduction histidine kinase/DNA-binding NarL/FixJ family response regulator
MSTRLRILHLEDNAADTELVQETLAKAGISCDLIRVQTENEFVSALQQVGIDLILADYTLPSFDGRSAFYRAQHQCPDVPFIFVSGAISEDAAIESLKIGMTDYVLKTRLSRLVPSVQRAIREANERAELRRSVDALRRSEAYLAMAQDLSHTGSFGWHVDNGEMFWSLETYRIFELDLLTKPTLDFVRQRVHPDDRARLEQIIDVLSAISMEPISNHTTLDRKDFHYEHRLLMPNGRVKYTRVTGRVVRDSGGDTEFVGAVTDVTAVKEAERELLEARVGERTRIARELHDTLLQSFHGLLLRFQAVSQLLPECPVEAKSKLEGAIAQAADAITEGRDAVQGLRDSPVQGNDLAQAISALGEELANDSTSHPPAAFHVSVEGEARSLHPIIRDEIYKVAAEAMRNAFRHADAQHVGVEIRYDHEQFRLRVRDDGKGIHPAVLSGKGAEGHYGLPGMRERATIAGGKLEVLSEVGAGTKVELCVPGSKVYATAERMKA